MIELYYYRSSTSTGSYSRCSSRYENIGSTGSAVIQVDLLYGCWLLVQFVFVLLQGRGGDTHLHSTFAPSSLPARPLLAAVMER